MTNPKDPQAELPNEKTPEGASSKTLRLNCEVIIPQARQVILDILSEYRELDFPANPELLKLHIDAATDRLDTIFQAHQLELLSELLGELPSRKRTDNDHEPTRQYLQGFNVALDQVVSVIQRKIGELNG